MYNWTTPERTTTSRIQRNDLETIDSIPREVLTCQRHLDGYVRCDGLRGGGGEALRVGEGVDDRFGGYGGDGEYEEEGEDRCGGDQGMTLRRRHGWVGGYGMG